MAIRVWLVGGTFFLISACGEVPPEFSSQTGRTSQKEMEKAGFGAKDEARGKRASAQKRFQQEVYAMTVARETPERSAS